MKDKLELQKQYIEVKKKYDELSEKYWGLDDCQEYKKMEDICAEAIENTKKGLTYYSVEQIEHVLAYEKDKFKSKLETELKDTFILLKSLNKQIYYEG